MQDIIKLIKDLLIHIKFVIKDINFVCNFCCDGDVIFIGDRQTIVDGQAYGILRWVIRIPDFPNYNNIERFMQDMQQQAVQNVINIENQKIELIKNSKFAGYAICE